MFKTVVLSLSILSAVSVGAKEYTLKDLPNSLKCKAESTNATLADSFEIADIKGEVWLNSLDARGEGPAEVSYFMTTINANNGCDNNYDIAFPTEDLVSLALGTRKEVVGIMKFFNSDSVCVDKGCEYAETAIVRCK